MATEKTTRAESGCHLSVHLMFSRYALRSHGDGLVLDHTNRTLAYSRVFVPCLCAIFFAFAPALMRQAQADDITTANGKVYHHVEVLTRNASAMLIRSDEGDTALSYDELKQADRDKYSKTLAKSIELPALTVIGEKPSFLEDTSRDKAVHSAQREIDKAVEEKKQAAAAKKDQPQQINMFNGAVGLSLGGSNNQPEGGLQPSYLGLQYQHLSPNIVEKDLKIFDDAINGKQ
jgi:hypothetical protein